MLVCLNKECANYKLELEDKTEVCPLCGSKPEAKKATSNPTLGIIAIIAAFAGFLIMWSMDVVIGSVIAGLALITSFVSKSKFAIIITILLVALLVGVLILFLKPF